MAKFVLLILVLLNITLVYQLVGSSNSIKDYRSLSAKRVQLGAELEATRRDNERLSSEIRLLKNDSAYLEKIVRQEMNLVKGNEVVYLKTSEINKNGGIK